MFRNRVLWLAFPFEDDLHLMGDSVFFPSFDGYGEV